MEYYDKYNTAPGTDIIHIINAYGDTGKVSEEDIELIKSHRNEFQQIVDTDELHIMPDELLEKGECKIESNSEIIDTDLNYQFSEIKKKLLRKE